MLRNAHAVHARNHWWFDGRRAIMEDILQRLLGSQQYDMLDVGAGSGAMIPVLEKFGVLSVVEPDSGFAALLAETFPGITVYNQSFEAFTAYQQYALVTMFDVLEHIADDRAAARAVYESLRPGGFFVGTVPALQFLWSEHDVSAHHYRRYRKKTLAVCLQSAGFRIERISYFNTLLFPVIAAVRLLDRGAGSDFDKGGGTVNGVLAKLFASERFWLRACNAPIGVSLLFIARKTT